MDFGKVNPEKAQQIINALKDGRINANEAKQLGLSAAEAEALTKAFSSGEVQVGDFVLVNKGKTEDGKKQITQTKKMASKNTFAKNLAKIGLAGLAFAGAGAVIGGAVGFFGGGVGAVPGAATGAKLGLALGAVFGVSSCDTFDGDTYNIDATTTITENYNFYLNINQEAKQTIENNPQLQKIIDLLLSTLTELQKQGTDVSEIRALLTTAVNQLADANAKIDDMTEMLVTINNNIKAYGDRNDKNAKTIIDIQNKILDAIGKLGTNNAKYFNAILTAITKNGAKLDELKALLEVINNNVVQGNEDQKEQVSKILEALSKFNFEVVDGMDKILKAVLAGNKKLDDIISLLNRMANLQKEYGDKGIKLGNNILNAVLSGKADLDKIVALLTRIETAQEKNHKEGMDLGNAILEAIGKIGGGDVSAIEAKLDAILAELVKGNGKMADMTKLLEKINNGVVANGKTQVKILEAIEKLGVNVTGGLNTIIEQLAKQPDYTKQLDTIISKLDNLDGDVKTGIAAILDAIGKKPNVDLSKILNKLDEILQAIKDHDVNVTVDVTGKVTCECNCGKHEGIIGDLNEILG